jgi:hypothetical protein
MAKAKAGRSVVGPIDIIGEFTEYAGTSDSAQGTRKSGTRKPRKRGRTQIGTIDIIGEFVEDASRQHRAAKRKKPRLTRKKNARPKE